MGATAPALDLWSHPGSHPGGAIFSMTTHQAAADRELERRRHRRALLERPVRLQIAGHDEVLALTANLSAGGLFVKIAAPPPVGTRVRFVVDLGERAVRGYAEVAWIRSRFPAADHPRGMGLRFVFVLDDGARHLADLVDAAESRDLPPR